MIYKCLFQTLVGLILRTLLNVKASLIGSAMAYTRK